MCVSIVGNPNIMDGWGCCGCRTYNGLWRDDCNVCLKRHCPIEQEDDVLQARKEEKQ
jgi:hypothetical protein